MFDDKRLSRAAGDFIERAAASGQQIAFSSITLAEIVYLIEKWKLPAETYPDLLGALRDPEHVFQEAHFTSGIVDTMRQVPRDEVPDMPDRMIAATALFLSVPVLSRDGRIRSSSVTTIW